MAENAAVPIPDEDMEAQESEQSRKSAKNGARDSPSKSSGSRLPGLAAVSDEDILAITTSPLFTAAVSGGVQSALKELLNKQTLEVNKVLDDRVRPLEASVGSLSQDIKRLEVSIASAVTSMQASPGTSLVDPAELQSLRDRVASCEQKPDFGSADIPASLSSKLQEMVDNAMASPARSEVDGATTPGRAFPPLGQSPTAAQYLFGNSPGQPSFGSPTGFPTTPSTIASAVSYNPYTAKPPATSDEWDRAEDPTIVVVSARVLLRDSDLLPILKHIVADAGVSASDVQLEVKKLYRSAIIRAVGPDYKQKHIVQQILANQREADGKSYKRHTCKDVSGAVADLFINPDKSPMHVRIEMGTKKLKQILEKELATGTKLEFNRAAGKVTHYYAEVAKVSSSHKGETKLQWKPSMVAKLGINKENILKLFQEDFGGNSDEGWV